MRRSVVAAAILIFLASVGVLSMTPTEISCQGYLTDGSGDPVVDSSYSIVFTIYDAASGGDSEFTETQSITTVDGLFSVLLGSVSPIVDTVFADSSRWLGLAVDGDPEIAPRTKLTSSAFAFRVARLDGAKGGRISDDVNIQGDARISTGHGASGTEAFVAGRLNTAGGFRSTVSGGSGSGSLMANTSVALTIPANLMSTVIIVSASSDCNSSSVTMRSNLLAFADDSLEFPAGLEYVDDLDVATALLE